jgi:16S rRNA (cytidine1402-2'-O)-methyltransferase
LRNTQLIIAENPAYTKRLLDHLNIEGKQLRQFADHNELEVLDNLVAELKTIDGSLVTDAGTPGISDPGFRLVRAAVAAGIAVVPIPGPSAAITALSAGGLPTDRFLFAGFLPKTEPKLRHLLGQAGAVEATLVAYESPQRVIKTLGIVARIYPTARVVVAREMTKLHEEFIRGTALEVFENLSRRAAIKGEITLLISFKK